MLAAGADSEWKEAQLKGDWSQVAVLLAPKKGQNFEQDLVLARAWLTIEKRVDALKLLASLVQTRKDERVLKLLNTAATAFFSQDTANRFYEGMRLLSVRKLPEARERFEQALAKEPGQILGLTRLAETEILLGQLEGARARVKEGLLLNPLSSELKAYFMRLDLLSDDAAGAPEESTLLGEVKKPYPTQEIPFTWALEYLKRTGEEAELNRISRNFLRDHPDWIRAQVWFYGSGILGASLKKEFKTQIDRVLKHRDRFETEDEARMKQSQYFWLDQPSYDDLVKNSR